jgi:hypothetical protein
VCLNIIVKNHSYLNITPETLKLVQERAGNTLELIGIGNVFLNRTQMAQQSGERIDKMELHEFKKLLYYKKVVTRLKRQPTEWEENFCQLYI